MLVGVNIEIWKKSDLDHITLLRHLFYHYQTILARRWGESEGQFSKLLHFVAPVFAPVFDQNVALEQGKPLTFRVGFRVGV